MKAKNIKELKRKNNEADKKLSKENSLIMTDIVCYIRGANLSEYRQEVIREDLLDMTLSAQERGEGIRTVIGEDYKIFCDEVIASLPQLSKKERILDVFDTILLCSAILGAINIVLSLDTINMIRDLIAGRQMHFQISFSVGNLISFGLIMAASFLIVEVICKTSLNAKKEQKMSKPKRFMIGGAIGGGVMGFFLIIAWFGKHTLFEANIFAIGLIVAGIYLAHKLLHHYLLSLN